MKKIIFLVLFSISSILVKSQVPMPALIGYWHNWSATDAPYIQLDQISSSYNLVEVAFAVPTSTTDMTMTFVPEVVTQQQLITSIQSLQSQSKKVLISIGGATTSIDLTTSVNKSAFITSMTNLINTYGFDGIDIDIENGNSIYIIGGGTIAAPANTAMINLIDAIKQIMAAYRLTHTQKLILTMAPETAYVQGGQSAFGNNWGGYLPIIDALRDSLDILQVQLYNSGTMYGIDGGIYTQGTADFIVAMTEATIHGFSTAGGAFSGLPASKVAVGLPACPNAAGGGYMDTATVYAAMKYLLGSGPKPGSYTLVQSGGYPNLRGMMTWSINWDAVSTCATSYEYARNYERIFGASVSINDPIVASTGLALFPNPADDFIQIHTGSSPSNHQLIEIFNSQGEVVIRKYASEEFETINVAELSEGIYFVWNMGKSCKFVKK
ncbi:MAG: glycosyl hydrolase family 18 protein [Bacteroidota bacterium]